ncbi:hypothetical protein EVAR_42028_1 [Eumeta japonica]|uniref:(+)RNA virus helicase C-terminal domain-containing protein n=1 Tax=Eumeta variegata TaxID=151549 RepID=A0A4C1Y8C2_EUMVA|nr:hypothetical protein EVAR_42028_1 [Eumeta japonica]
MRNKQSVREDQNKKNPLHDPIVITARCTKVVLDERILKMVEAIARCQASGDACENWVEPNITRVNGVPGCRKTTNPMDVAYALNEVYNDIYSSKIQGFGKGEGSCILTIHEAQGLTSQGTIIVRTTTKQKLHDSVSYGVVAITRHTVSCLYSTDDGDDPVYRFVNRALAASDERIYKNNAKMAIQNRDSMVMTVLANR